MIVVGLDLAGLPSNPTGFALLSNRKFKTGLVHYDEEIFELFSRRRSTLAAIDAPLSLPIKGNLRQADRLLIKRGLRVFPPTFAGMKKLTDRGILVAAELRKMEIRVIEVHPRTSGVILFGTAERKEWLKRLRKKGLMVGRDLSEHEADAIMAALTGGLYLKGSTEEVGTFDEGAIVIPCGSL